MKVWATEIAPWESVVESIRANFGECWSCYHLANISAGIRSHSETCADAEFLFEESKSLCRRFRYARLRAGSARWWARRLEKGQVAGKGEVLLLLLSTWAGSSAIIHSIDLVNKLVEDLSQATWMKLYRSIADAIEITRRTPKDRLVLDVGKLPPNLSERAVLLLSLRTDKETRHFLINRFLAKYEGSDRAVLRVLQESLLWQLAENALEWSAALPVIRRTYYEGEVADPYSFQILRRTTRESPMPIEIAEEVARNADFYPSFIVAMAEVRCREAVASRVVPLGAIAVREGWTFA